LKDGLEFLLDLRAHPDTASVPVFRGGGQGSDGNGTPPARRERDALLAKSASKSEQQTGEQAAMRLLSDSGNRVKEHAESTVS